MAAFFRRFPFKSTLIGPPRYRVPSIRSILGKARDFQDFMGSRSDLFLETGEMVEMQFSTPIGLGDRSCLELQVKGSHIQPVPMLLGLQQARVVDAEGTIVTATDHLFGENSPWGIEDIESRNITLSLFPQKCVFMKGTFIFCAGRWAHGYFHWLFDYLDRLIPLLPYKELMELPVIIPCAPNDLQRESLKMLGFHNLIEQPKTSFCVERLLFPTPVRKTHCPPSWILKSMRKLLGVDEGRMGTDRIYISRHDASRRRVKNEEELFCALQKRGFRKVLLAGLTLKEQVEMFNRASCVVGANGSNFSNLLFCPPETKVLELFSPQYLHGAPCALAQTLAHKYTYLVGEAVDETDMTIPVNKVMDWVDSIFSS